MKEKIPSDILNKTQVSFRDDEFTEMLNKLDLVEPPKPVEKLEIETPLALPEQNNEDQPSE